MMGAGGGELLGKPAAAGAGRAALRPGAGPGPGRGGLWGISAARWRLGAAPRGPVRPSGEERGRGGGGVFETPLRGEPRAAGPEGCEPGVAAGEHGGILW